MENQEFYWRTLLKNIEWIKFSETKAVFLLTLYGVIITIIYSNAKEVFEPLSTSSTLILLTIISAIFSMICISFCFLTINPVLKNDDPNSIIYFGHIKQKFNSSEEYRNYSQQILEDDQRFISNLTDQVYITSKIAWRKFKFISWGIRCFLLAILFLVLEITVYLFSV